MAAAALVVHLSDARCSLLEPSQLSMFERSCVGRSVGTLIAPQKSIHATERCTQGIRHTAMHTYISTRTYTRISVYI